MSLSSALSIALSGLHAASTALSVSSSNIANAQTPGYTAKSVNYSAVTLGTDEGGVDITGYTRATNSALTASLNQATTSASYLSTQYSYMQQLQSILDSSSSNPTLSSDISTFQSDWQQLSSSPESSIMQQTVINDGTKLANDINSINTQVTALQKQVSTDVGTSVTTLNGLLQQVQTLNTQITAAMSANQQTGDLEDARDTAITQIAAITGVTVMDRGNGQVALYTPSGTALVDGTARSFSYNGTTVTDSSGNDVSSSFTGGSLQAQLSFIDTSASAAASTSPGAGEISKVRAQLGSLVDAFTGATSSFATAYSAAATSSTASGASQNGDSVASSFFTVTYSNPLGVATSGQNVTFSGNVGSPQTASVTVNGKTYTYAIQSTDTLSNVASGLASLVGADIPGTTSSGGVLTVGGTGTISAATTSGVPNVGSMQVNASLLNSSSEMPQTGVSAVSDSFDATQDYVTSGLTSRGSTYAQLVTGILSAAQTSANSLKSASSDASTQASYYSTALSSATGVNTDTELVNLTTLQNCYAAAAHVISTVQTLLSTLENIL